MEIFKLIKKQVRRKEEAVTFFVLKKLLGKFMIENDIKGIVNSTIVLTRFLDFVGSIVKICLVLFLCMYVFNIEIAMFFSWIYIFICKYILDQDFINNYVRSDEYKFYKLNCKNKKKFFKAFILNNFSTKFNDLIIKIFVPIVILIGVSCIYTNSLILLSYSIINGIIITIASDFIVLLFNNTIRNDKNEFVDIFKGVLIFMFSILIIFTSNYIYGEKVKLFLWVVSSIILAAVLIYSYKKEIYKLRILNFYKVYNFNIKNNTSTFNIVINNYVRLFLTDGFLWKVLFFQILILILGIVLYLNNVIRNVNGIILINSINMIIFIASQMLDRKVIDNIRGHFFMLKVYKKAKLILLVECFINIIMYLPILIIYMLMSKGYFLILIPIYYLAAIVYHTMKTRKNIYSLTNEDLVSDRYTVETKIFKIGVLDYIVMTIQNTLLFTSIGFQSEKFIKYSVSVSYVSVISNLLIILAYSFFVLYFLKDLFLKRSNISVKSKNDNEKVFR